MSLSRVFKNSSKMVFQDVVSIHSTQDFIDHVMNQDDVELNYQSIVKDEETPTTEVFTPMQSIKTDEELQQEIALRVEEAVDKARKDAFNQAYEEHRVELKNELTSRLQNFDKNVNLLLNESKTMNEKFNEALQVETIKLSLALTQKVLHQQISQDSSILRELILNEIQQESRLNIHSIEISRHALQLMDSLEFELKNQGISIISVDQPIDHINIVGEYGHYDISINTQFKEIRKTLHQWLK
jgi:flagellar biosynthesis/type III secretory pathway protein FliH